MLFAIVSALNLNEYIVQYKPESDVEADVVIGDYKASFVTLTNTQALRLNKDEDVLHVERNGLMYTTGTQSNPLSWGLDRIDARSGLDKSFTYAVSAGKGVTAYVIDTGINTNHTDFEGRAVFGFDATGEGKFDGNG